MNRDPWKSNGFLSNFNISVNRLGYQHAPIAYGLAMSDWESEDDLVNFLYSMTKE